MENTRVCYFCTQENATYTCPRCNSLYCSKTCYQSQAHTNCSEQFYKQCVEDELKLENVDDTEKKRMLEILHRIQNEADYDDTDSDDDSIPDLNERLENVNLDDADQVWNCLSEQEKLEFQAILQAGDISKLIPKYEPWWCKRYEKKVEEVDQEKEYKSICPRIAEIVPFNSLSKAKPSPCVLWNIVNVLAAYAFAVRRYIGEHSTDEGADTILKICTNLNCNQNFENIETAVDSVTYHANNIAEITCTTEEAILVREDVDKILLGPEKNSAEYYILAALSDLQELFTKVAKTKKGSKTSHTEFSKKFSVPCINLQKSKLQNSLRKLVFYISWSKKYYNSKM